MQLSKNVKPFSQYFAQVLESTSDFKHKKMSLLAYVFSKLQTVKCWNQ